uniref:phosphoserine phosphatase n=1 Tax=Oryza australiensis TaxID=4532 RepID=G8JB83_9ORYZ|nr:Utp11 [Oryza australiensis]
MAGEVKRPGKTFLRVLLSAVAMTTVGYLLPLMASTGAIDAAPEDCGNGFFADAAGKFSDHQQRHRIQAMTGIVAFEDALAARLSLIKPSLSQVDDCLVKRPRRISPGIDDLIKKLKANNTDVFLVSGGFRQMIKDLKSQLQELIPEQQCTPALSLCHVWKTASSYRELEERKQRVQKLEKLYADMALQKELKKPGRKRKLREDEIENQTSQPVYKWRAQWKR